MSIWAWSSRVMNQKTSDIHGYASLLQEVKGTDSETGLLTRTNLYNKLIQELARCDRYGNKLAIASVRIVDPEGEATKSNADELANEVGNQLGAVVRNVDFAARWSDHEFLVVLPETEEEGARLFINKVDEMVARSLEERGDSDLSIETHTGAWESGDDMARMLAKVEL